MEADQPRPAGAGQEEAGPGFRPGPRPRRFGHSRAVQARLFGVVRRRQGVEGSAMRLVPPGRKWFSLATPSGEQRRRLEKADESASTSCSSSSRMFSDRPVNERPPRPPAARGPRRQTAVRPIRAALRSPARAADLDERAALPKWAPRCPGPRGRGRRSSSVRPSSSSAAPLKITCSRLPGPPREGRCRPSRNVVASAPRPLARCSARAVPFPRTAGRRPSARPGQPPGLGPAAVPVPAETRAGPARAPDLAFSISRHGRSQPGSVI